MRKQNRIFLFSVVSLLTMVLLVTQALFTLGDKTKELKTVEAADDGEFQEYGQDDIVKAMGSGWNLGNQLEASSNGTPGETYYGNPVINEDLILAVKAAGFRSIRIPVSYLSKIGQGPSYTIDSAWLDRIQEVVDMCVDNGLYAIINMHGDGYNTVNGGWFLCNGSDQETIKAKYKAVWQQIATRFAEYDEHLIYESMNEEFDGNYSTPNKTYYQNINDYNQIFIDTVRQTGGNNDKRWLLIPGWNTDIEYTTGDYGFQLPTDNYVSKDCSGKRVMISVHYYSPWEFCGDENNNVTQWGENATDSSKIASWGDESFMQTMLKKMYDKFVTNGYPVVIGEYGAIDKTYKDASSNEYRAFYCETLCKYAKQYGCVPVYWDNGYNGNNGFGLFDRTNYKVTQQKIIDAVMKYYRSEERNTSTAITLDQSKMTIYVGDDKKAIKATLTPTDSQDLIVWSSSDESVATVNGKGQVEAVGVGTATITATANGHQASCIVTVPQNESVRAKLYLLESKNWQSIESDTFVEIPKEGGQFSLSLSATETQLSNIGSLYIKDISISDDTPCVFDYVKMKVDSFEVNGTKYEMSQDTFIYDKSADETAANNVRKAFDFAFVNVWDTTYVNNMTVENWNYKAYFNDITLSDNNKVTITFTISEVNHEQESTTPTKTPEATKTPEVTASPTVTSTPKPTQESITTGDISATFFLNSDWGTGAVGQIEFTNDSGKNFMNGWTIEFDLDREITQVWDGEVVEAEDSHYVISNPNWSKELKNGQTYTLHFMMGTGSKTPQLSNIKFVE